RQDSIANPSSPTRRSARPPRSCIPPSWKLLKSCVSICPPRSLPTRKGKPDDVAKKVKEKAKEPKPRKKGRRNRTNEDTFTIVQQAEMEIRALGWGMS